MSYSLIEIFALALALSVDAMAVALGYALAQPKLRVTDGLKLALSFGAFQCAMPIAGYFSGEALMPAFEAYDHWIAFILLAGVAINMVREAYIAKEGETPFPSALSLGLLLTLSVATSIDALAVGISFRMADFEIYVPSVIIGVTCAALTAAAIKLGLVIGRRLKVFEKPLAIFGAAVLVAIGLEILYTHGVF